METQLEEILSRGCNLISDVIRLPEAVLVLGHGFGAVNFVTNNREYASISPTAARFEDKLTHLKTREFNFRRKRIRSWIDGELPYVKKIATFTVPIGSIRILPDRD